ncbi:MAG: hypothetical protein QM296_07965, partial [Bacillota bacterium]|nr:hypothetical protein [Bacillota bacterium]
MKRKMLAVLLMLCTLLALFSAPVSAAAVAPTYDPNDVAVLNAIAAAHPQLGWAQAPEDGTAEADGWDGSVWWNEETPMRVTRLDLEEMGLGGSLDVGGLTELYILDCSDNELTELNVRGAEALEYLHCDHNKLTELDLSQSPALYWVHCEHNVLTTLNVTGLTNLKYFYCNNNRLSSLDLSNREELWEVSCYNNQLTYLNVEGCTELDDLDCSYNLLADPLNVNDCTELRNLNCSCNRMSGTLDVSNTALVWLYCNDNRLSGLNLSGLTDLYYVDCYFNQLTSLDVSGLTALEILDCFSNKLTTLDVRGLSELYYLDCDDNQLTSLHVRGLASLQYLYCRYNYLTELDVYGTDLRSLRISSNCLADKSKVTGKDINWDERSFQYETQYPEYIDVTFTAEQTGGVSGTQDSTGIVLTFSQAIEDLSGDEIWGWCASDEFYAVDFICSDESNVSDTWTIVLEGVYIEEEVSITVVSFANYRMPKEPQTTMIYKASEQKTYNVTVHGGTADPETAEAGTDIEITANPPAAGKRFTGWTVNSGGAVLEDETAVVTTFKMPASDVEVTANYEDVYYDVTV